MSDGHPVVLFDGVCNLCNGVVNFLIDHDPEANLRFAAIQSEAGQALLARFQVVTRPEPETVYLVDGGTLYDRSSAALRLLRYVRGPWRLMRVFRIVPRPLRDVGYKLIAKNRYRWFGKTDACRRPTPDLLARFLA